MKNSTKATSPTQTDAPHQERPGGRSKPLNLSNPLERDAHIAAFLAWLPKVLRDAPNIDWSRLPSSVMGYLLRHMVDNPDSIAITLAVGCIMHAVKKRSLHTYCSQLTNLLRRLRTRYDMKDIAQLRSRDIWDRFVAERTITQSAVRMLMIYETLASIHLRTYLEDLPERQRLFWEQ